MASKFTFVLFGYLLLGNITIYAQYNNRFWCFGDSAGIDFTNLSMPVPFYSNMDSPYACTSISDSLGLLMYVHNRYWPFYIQGSQRTTVVRNRYHQIMQNGDSLVGDWGYDGLTLINKPGYDSLFYLFQWGFNFDVGLYYSIINPYFNNDSGKVISKNIKLTVNDSLLDSGFKAVRHGNGRDWWIITRNGTSSNRYNLFYIGKDTVVGPIGQSIGFISAFTTNNLFISEQGDKLCLVCQYGDVELYDFDRCTGVISNPVQINMPGVYKRFWAEFSQSGRFLYIANVDNIFGDSLRLYQVDLSVPNPSNAVQLIYINNVPASGGNLRRGPDGKIYFTCLYDFGWPYADSVRNGYNENLGVINYPDSIGLSCNFMPFSFHLGGRRTYWSLPNNANFDLGNLQGSSCDTILSVSEIDKSSVKIFPSPAVSSFSIDLSSISNYEIIINVTDILGRIVFNCKTRNRDLISIDCSKYRAGIYFVKFQNNSFSFEKNISILNGD